jgi:hypothetical protein
VALDPVRGEKGLWRAPTSEANEPGVHALIIGISEYPFMAGGARSGDVSNNYGLGQLYVSAKTAARLFGWLRARDSFAERPLKSCRLLLSPQHGREAEYVAAVAGENFDLPDFESVRRNIIAWADEFRRQRSAQFQANASIFFFSGHGLEYSSTPSIVARDFLDPTSGEAGLQYNVAILGLRNALRTYNLSASFFFIDACRNVPFGLMTVNPVGDPVLKPSTTFVTTPRPLAWIQATSTGAFAYSPADVEADGTFFGQALINALSGYPPAFVPYDLEKDPCQLRFGQFESFVKTRTHELLSSVNRQLTQLPEAGGDPYEWSALLAETPRSSFRAETPAEPKTSSKHAAGALSEERPESTVVSGLTSGQANATAKVWETNWLRKLGPATLVAKPLTELQQDGTLVHNVLLKHEYLTGPWLTTFSFCDVPARRREPSEPPFVAQVRSADQAGTLTVWLDLLIGRGEMRDTVWISVGGGRTGWPKLAVALPRDVDGMPVRLEAVFSHDSSLQSGMLQSFTARVGPPSLLPSTTDKLLVRIWKGIWEAQRSEIFSSLQEAAAEVEDVEAAEKALSQKGRSPIAAAIGTAILLQTGALERLRDWPRNLVLLFNNPEGAVLWSETLFKRAEAQHTPWSPEAVEYFGKISGLGPPRLSSVLGMAVRRLDTFASLGAAHSLHGDMQLASAINRVRRAAQLARSGGTFAAFGPLPDDFDPDWIYGSTL